ncbi:MAG: class I SAM-dependent methyltransferase [Deltaproteobacteria bacterium]
MTTESLSPAARLMSAYEGKATAYFTNARADFVRLLPRDPTARVLEIGCGNGATGALAMARGRAGRYVGVELIETQGRKARQVLSDVLIGDVEHMDFDWQPAEFDALILSEVLEHLLEPGLLLRRLHRFVRPGGMVLASSPNIAHWRVLRELVKGRFDLADQGVFDRTHLRWFTPATFAAMFEIAGFRIDHIRPVTPFSPRVEMISRLTSGRLDHLFMTQIAVQGTRR